MIPTRARQICWLIAAGLCTGASSLAAQDPDTTTSVAAPVLRRASWFTDQRVFQVGDIITVIVDEQVVASERSIKNARSDRNLNSDVGIQDGGFLALPTSALGFSSSQDQNSRISSEANRRGDLNAVLSVRVVGFEPNGLLRVAGERSVKIDGREQKVTLAGVVRSDDISPSNIVLSSRIAGATITYDGKTIAPSKGILGKILSIFWP